MNAEAEQKITKSKAKFNPKRGHSERPAAESKTILSADLVVR
jgi:hypothetical protein